MTTYSVLSLFSGIGGIDLGLERSGRFETIAYSEVDPYADRIMQLRFPDASSLGDITNLSFEINDNGTVYIENESTGEGHWLPPIDIIVGGFPCQDISLAGKGAGINGERSGLWSHYARAIRLLRPRGILVENVAALTRRGLDRVLGDLASCGYDAEWDCIPARAVGAPHQRDRIYILAYPSSIGMEGHWSTWIKESPASGEAWIPRRDRAGEGAAHWQAEPGLDRLADGVPHWVDRLRCLGNAVVPQVIEHLAPILLDRIEQPIHH